ncbi:hypothetical protein ACIQUD_31850 [Streptomyces globisporus]|uniref:hypothetical protein n=1 Tax=Streptomyces globisporus TaxID=1908 RepID=UPI0038229656
MRRPQLHRPTPNHTWAHPYTGPLAMAVFYNDGGDPPEGGTPNPVDPPKPGPPAQRTFTQAEVEALAAKEKAQGKRSAAKEFAEKHGFSTIEDAEQFIAAARQSQEAALSEQEKREKALADREALADAKEKAAAAKEREANRRIVLAGLGATGDDLDDATALLRAPEDADADTLKSAAEALKTRRPELFGTAPQADPTRLPPAPHGAPAGTPPSRQSGGSKPGDRGREMARLRGHKPAA